MTDLFRDLQKLDLTENQSLTYLTLFRMGETKAGAIIKKTGLHRNLVYRALDELEQKRLITHAKVRGITHYKPLAPSQLLTAVHERERVAKQVIADLSLVATHNVQEITVYEGVDELREHERRTYTQAKDGSTLRYLGVSPQWYELMGPTLVAELAALQKKKKLILKHIVPSVTENDKQYKKETGSLSLFKESELITSDTSCTVITDRGIAIRSYIGPYFVVEITQPQLAQNYQNYFEYLWSIK